MNRQIIELIRFFKNKVYQDNKLLAKPRIKWVKVLKHIFFGISKLEKILRFYLILKFVSQNSSTKKFGRKIWVFYKNIFHATKKSTFEF
jgi:hypothetical protein